MGTSGGGSGRCQIAPRSSLEAASTGGASMAAGQLHPARAFAVTCPDRCATLRPRSISPSASQRCHDPRASCCPTSGPGPVDGGHRIMAGYPVHRRAVSSVITRKAARLRRDSDTYIGEFDRLHARARRQPSTGSLPGLSIPLQYRVRRHARAAKPVATLRPGEEDRLKAMAGRPGQGPSASGSHAGSGSARQA